MPAGFGEVGVEDPELADRLGSRDGLVGVVDRGLELGDQPGIGCQVGHRGAGRLAVLLLPEVERVRVQGEQAGDERAVVADDHALADQRMSPEPVFEHRGSDVLAARRDDQFLLAAGHGKEPLLIERADVAGVQEAVCVERLGGGLRVAPVAAEDHRAADQDLAVVGDPYGGAGDRQADGADLVAARPVHDGGRGGLGQAVTLEHGDAGAAEEVPEPLPERCPAGHRVLDPAADGGPELAVHQAIEYRVPQPLARADAAAGRLQAIAVSAAARKILLFTPLAEACCWAELYTFSKTRGTASKNTGLTSGRPRASVDASGQCSRTAPPSMQATWMILANECASGRNSRVDDPSMLNSSCSAPSTAFRPPESRLRWVSSQPFGRPVVPEV